MSASARAALAAGAALLLAGCAPSRGCAGDVCTDGTLRRAGTDSATAAWSVAGDDGTTYELVGGVPSIFRHDGLRVRLVGRDRPKSAGTGRGRPVTALRLETVRGAMRGP